MLYVFNLMQLNWSKRILGQNKKEQKPYLSTPAPLPQNAKTHNFDNHHPWFVEAVVALIQRTTEKMKTS